MNIPWEAITALAMYVIASTVGFVWWMSDQTTTMRFLKETLAELVKQNALYATKTEVTEKIILLTSSINKAWDKIDVLMVRNSSKKEE